MFYFCCDERERRRNEIEGRPDLNGIAFLEVLDDRTMPNDQRQRTLFVHFINDPSSLTLSKGNVRIDGGERIRDILVSDARIALDPRSGTGDAVLIVEVDQPGDFSIYTLRLVPSDDNPLDQIDPVLRAVDFSFKVNCESDFDCRPVRICPVEPLTEPAIDYLAKDYASFRQLMLDRLAVLMPEWQERNPADLGIALIEMLAYVGDYLSYRQDAIATEAYLGAARRRVSARRHARLVDYLMHDGSNARAWVHVEVEGGRVSLEKGTPLLTTVAGQSSRIQPDTTEAEQALKSGAVVFETMDDFDLFPAHNELCFYTWGARECCLPKGATRATLRGYLPDLNPEMVLIFQEVRSPRSGDPDDADLTRRHAVRLTQVTPAHDPIGGRFDDPPTDAPLEVTEIQWADDDKLPFPLCISAETEGDYGRAYVDNVSVALGNIVLADHGRTLKNVPLGQVPASKLERVFPPERSSLQARPIGGLSAEDDGTGDGCREKRTVSVPSRFRPLLPETPMTQAAPYKPDDPPSSAHATMHWSPGEALPAIKLHSRTNESEPDVTWEPQRDLLNSRPEANEFVAEVESDGRTHLRFGDGSGESGHGARPREGASFTASYRVGNGVRGNLGANTLVHIVSDDPAIVSVTNPLPAQGGVEPESIEEVRQKAPSAFRTQERAVTPEDYAARSSEHRQVQRAAATLRWTGSWHTVFVSIDRLGGARVTEEFETELRDHLEPFRLAGHDLEIDRPRMVPLEIAMRVQVKPDYYRSDVKVALLQLFSNRTLPDGRRGIFHPDNFTFGQTVYLSPLYAAAQAVDGVDSAEITTFQRWDAPDAEALEQGKLILGRLEIARLDNDPNSPDRGTFRLTLEGGK